MPSAAWATAQSGLSGAGSRLIIEAVTLPEAPAAGAFTRTVTVGADGEVKTYTGNVQSTFVVLSGPCTVAEGGRCVGRWPGGYLPNENCAISVAGAGGAIGACPVFDTNNNVNPDLSPSNTGDYLDLFGLIYWGADCPAGQPLAAGQELAWHSDDRYQGFVDLSSTHFEQSGGGLPFSGYGAGGGGQICF